MAVLQLRAGAFHLADIQGDIGELSGGGGGGGGGGGVIIFLPVLLLFLLLHVIFSQQVPNR